MRKLGFGIVYLDAKFDDSSFSHSRDVTGGPKKIKVGHVTLTALLLRVVCHQLLPVYKS